MKKLMIALAAVACAAGVQAAQISWQSMTAGGDATLLVDATDKTTALTAVPDGGSIVLIKLLAADLTSFQAGTWSADSATVLNTATVGSSGKATGKVTGVWNFSYTEGGANPIADGDYLAAVLKTSDGKYQQLTYVNDEAVKDVFTVNGLADDGNIYSKSFNYATAGNFTAAAVPEPTSAMLLLLGVAGLALRRRRA